MRTYNRMNSRKTRRGGGSGFNRIKAQTLRGSGVLSAIKKGIYGSKSPKYKMDVTAAVSYDKDMYEIAGTILEDIGEFSFVRAQSYIDIYLKRAAIDIALKKYSNAARIIGYNTYYKKSIHKSCQSHNSKGGFCSCQNICPGTYIISGIVLQPTHKAVSAGTRRLTQTRSRSKSKSN